ncbi:MAG: chemotaxis protein CheR [Pedobacter sp.]|nr:MAG: chemotaxis protein CheR [Pedobacter sp.]
MDKVNLQTEDIDTITDQTVNFPVIALVGSAGSLQALEDFFSAVPNNSGFAFVVVIHLPKESIYLPSIIQKFTPLPVLEVNSGIYVEQDHVYVVPPMKNMVIHEGQLILFEMESIKSVTQSIDFFLKSLAEEKWDRAASIILSGSGNDGQLGTKLIAEKLGLTMAQDPDSSQCAEMPAAAVETGTVRFIHHPKEMPKQLLNYFDSVNISNKTISLSKGKDQRQITLQKILLLLRVGIGHDFTQYKTSTILRRIERRMNEQKISSLEGYLEFITDNLAEMNALFKEMLIGVTKFFRDPLAFDAIATQIQLKITAKNEGENLRVWIAGCSTGEEAYSIAILVLEILRDLPNKQKVKVQIFATDLDEAAVVKARVGWYDSRITADVSADRLNRFFTKRNDGYAINKELRELIVFAKHSLLNDAPFIKLDLLCCRNVMIYFSPALQKRLYPVFHYSLVNGGLLFLGPAETIGGFEEIFKVINPKWKIFERQNSNTSLLRMTHFPFNISVQQLKTTKLKDKSITKIPMTNSFNQILIDHYTPASLLVNEKGDILYIHGDINDYMNLQTGEAGFNIHRVLKNELKHSIGNAIHQVSQHKKNITNMIVKIPSKGKNKVISVSVDYLKDTSLQGLLIVSFNNLGDEKIKRVRKANETDDNAVIKELESELDFTKRQLSSTIEQMDSSLEELKSTNDELQSTNEELQSTNEEALTTKEEMQSLNEELMTINLQHQAKTEELTLLNNDMKNLLDNTEIGTIFLDNNLRILRFTPHVTKLFNVIPQDVGRLITHVVSNFDYPEIEDSIKEVVESLVGKELEVSTKNGDWYNLRIMPYRTLDNFISGAVLAFTRITPLKSMENKLEQLLKFAKASLELLEVPAIMFADDDKILAVNSKFLKLFRIKMEEISEQSFRELVINNWKANQLAKLTDGDFSDDIYLSHDFPVIGHLQMTVKLQSLNLDNEVNLPKVALFSVEAQNEKEG